MSTILACDDDPLILESIELLLGERGHSVMTAVNGAEAMKAIVQRRPDVVLLDIAMPEMDGLKVLEAIKGRPAMAGVPVIMLTARSRIEDVTAAVRRGAADYVVKPFDADELSTRVQNALAIASNSRRVPWY
ncbi:response regulator transcription factor [Cucumibacter marinus]|uniref:response regulator transcription factor n=1 Tax=Cucumibacter marinus TaxID=1121252 RepID=UPI000410C92B|nr:response regulator [Cucumibacter marinus]